MSNLESLHYSGKVRLVFRTGPHLYFLNGKEVPSVSGISRILDTPSEDFTAVKSELLMMYAVKKALGYVEEHAVRGFVTPDILKAAKSAHRRHTQEAADIGTAVHKFCELYIKNMLAGNEMVADSLPKDPKVLNGALAFLDWVTDRDVKFHASEQRVCSKKHKYAGTTDFIATIGGRRAVGDFKTGRKYPEHGLQLAGYMHAYNEEFPDTPVVDRWDLLLNKETGEFGAHLMPNPDDEKTFLALIPIRKWMYQPIT